MTVAKPAWRQIRSGCAGLTLGRRILGVMALLSVAGAAPTMAREASALETSALETSALATSALATNTIETAALGSAALKTPPPVIKASAVETRARAAAPQGLVIERRAAPPGLDAPPPFPRPRPVFVDRAADLTKAAPKAYRTRARNALIVDLTSGETLYEHRPDRAIPPASMTKIMTAYVAFEAIASGEIAADRVVRISDRAAAQRGSSMRLRAGETARVIDLIEGLVIASGNDAATALAEALSGSEARFAKRMTERAAAIGMGQSRFKNASGLPAKGHAMSLRDLASLAVQLERDFPERMPMFARRGVEWRGVRLRNRNPALRLNLRDLGAVADGLKTGHTNAAGYCVVATATQTIREPGGGPPTKRRVAVVLAGLASEAERARETERALRWALARP